MRKKIVIFGAGGTLGLYLVDHLSRLLSADEWEVIASGRSDIAFFDRYAPLVRYVQADITDEKSFAALPQQDVYAVVHFAGALPAYMEGYDPRRYVDANVMGTLNVLEYARTAGADRVLYTQTISDYTGYFGEMIERRSPLRSFVGTTEPLTAWASSPSAYRISTASCTTARPSTTTESPP